jgi:regulator of replication initiation timing
LDEGVERLKSRIQELGLDIDESDDLDSIASCSTVNAMALSRMNRTVRFSMPSRQVELLENKLTAVEVENGMLRQELEELRLRLSGRNKVDGNQAQEEKKTEEKDDAPSVVLSEGNVFNFVRGLVKN